MAGTFPGVAGVQQIDLNGKPNVGALLYVYIGGTNDLSATFQDLGLAIPAPNPLVADATGRIPLFFVADGTYKVRLVDQFGNIANGGFEQPQVPSVGASSSGGGGSAVDPTTILGTGDVKWQMIDGSLPGFVRMNGRTLGNAVSGASERANADALALYSWIWTNFPQSIFPIVGGGRGGSALADFNAGKQITLADMRLRGPFGLDTMGNASSGRGTGVTVGAGITITTPGGNGGEGAHVLVIPETPNHNHAITDPGHTHAYTGASASNPGGPDPHALASPAAFNTGNSKTNITLAAVGGDQPHNNMPPFLLGTWYLKL